MIRHLRKLILLLSIVVILSGCWDQRLLKDVKIIHGTGIDLIDKGQIELTLAIQTSTLQTKADMVPVLSEVGRTVREGRMKMDRRISASWILLVIKSSSCKRISPSRTFMHRWMFFSVIRTIR